MSYLSEKEKWLNSVNVDKQTKDEIRLLKKEEEKEAFEKDLEFGTGGIREVMGVGKSKINTYTIRKITLGIVFYLKDKYKESSVAISYDNRLNSKNFAYDIASLLSSFGITVYIYKDLRPTPMLSYLVRSKKTTLGIMITASHNPKEYNGYKVYNSEGCQLNIKEANMLIKYINSVDNYLDLKFEANNSLINIIDESFDDIYFDDIKDLDSNNDNKNIKVVYTPLHGTGSTVIPKFLKKLGYNVITVDEQMVNDPNFSNTKSSNPEDCISYELAIEYAKKNNADIIIATDPDADRLGVGVLNNNEYVLLNGNETASIMFDYLIKNNKKKNSYLFTTVVSSILPIKMAIKNNINYHLTLTGFKFIGDEIAKLKNKDSFLYGFEESYGSLLKPCVRDKDAIQASIFLCLIANKLKNNNKTLLDYQDEIFTEYGYYKEGITNIKLSGETGSLKINKIINYFRNNDIDIVGHQIIAKEDYQNGIRYVNGKEEKINLPTSNVIKYILDNDFWFTLRPSGTEPKLKIYYGIKTDNKNKVEKVFKDFEGIVLELIDNI